MPIVINGKKLIPAPFVTINKSTVFTDDGSALNSVYNITFEGTLLPNKGSPTSKGFYEDAGEPPTENFTSDTDRFRSLTRKQEYLKELLSQTGYKVSYYPAGQEPIEFYPRLISLDFSPGSWVIRSDYKANFEAPFVNRYNSVEDQLTFISGTRNLNLQSVSDGYSITESEDGRKVIQIKRTTAAQAKVAFDNPTGSLNREPWLNAKEWVTRRVTDAPFTTGMSVVIPTGASLFNKFQDETIDQFAGRYQLSTTYTYNVTSYIDERTVTRTNLSNLVDNLAPDITNIEVRGRIRGLAADNTPSGKLAAAYSYWNSIASGIGAIVGANGKYTQRQVVEDQVNGALDYSLSFTNNDSGNKYSHNYTVNYTLPSEGFPSVTIEGKIEGLTPDTHSLSFTPVPSSTKIGYAITGWTVIEPQLKSLAFAYSNLTGSSSSFYDFPSNKTVNFDRPNGVISYAYTYGYSNVNNSAQPFTHDFTIEFSTDNGPATGPTAANYKAGLLVTATINGTVGAAYTSTGFIINTSGRYENAVSGWNSIKHTLFNLVNSQYQLIGDTTPPLSSGVVRRTVSMNRINGNISYSASYNNLAPASAAGVAVQDMSVEDTYGGDLHAIQLIPGRSVGPIIQNIASRNENRRNINITITMYPNAGGWYTYSDKNTPWTVSSGMMASVVPPGTRKVDWFIASDTDNWQWRNGLYTRNITIVY